MFFLKRMLPAILLALALLGAVPDHARAQGCGQQNPNCIVATAPPGTSNNQAASTEFVQDAVAAATIPYTDITGLPANSVLGSLAGGNAAALTPTQLTTLCNVFSTSLKGCVPAPGSVSGKVLSDNGSWVVAASGLSNVAVTGPSTTFTSSQCSANVERSNSNVVMGDFLPGTGSFLPASCVVTITNNDTSALWQVSAASGATIRGGYTVNGFLYLGPGQTGHLQSDGAGNYWPISWPTRAKFGANTTIFIATTGSDSTGNGLTAGTAFATLNKAWSFAQSVLDLSCLKLTLQHATGNYPQAVLLQGQMVGQCGPGSVVVQGSTGTPANVTFPGPGGATVSIDVEGGAQIQLQGVTLTSAAGQSLVIGSSSIVNFQSNAVGVASGASLTAVRGGNLNIIGSYSVTGNQSVHFNANAGGIISVEAAGVVISVTGTITQEFALAQDGGTIFYDFVPSYSGTMTGPKWAISNCGQIATVGLSFPGTVSGAIVGTCGSFN